MLNEVIFSSVLIKMRLDLFIKIYKSKLYFFTYFLNRDFFLAVISITLLFGDLVDNVHLEGTLSQNFDLKSKFSFNDKKWGTFYYFF